MKLLLASKSQARRAMLENAAVAFDTIDSPFDEEKAKQQLAGLAPRALAQELARLKALSVDAGEGTLVLGADQVLERDDGSTLGKPRSHAEAMEQLRSLSAKSHFLHSAAAIAECGSVAWRHVETVRLTLRPLEEAFLEDYLDREYEAIRWSVGGYRIEGPGVQLFEAIEGSHFAILGLPLLPLLAYLRERGLPPS